jgi:hypothetical protein
MTYKLSYSQLNLFDECSYKWKLSYLDGLKTSEINSPLFFGSALDASFEYLLLSKKEDLTEEELTLLTTKTVYEVFDLAMNVQDGKTLPDNPDCFYFASDFDPELLTIKDLAELKKYDSEVTDYFLFFNQCRELIKAKKPLPLLDQKLHNLMCWMSLYRKGLLMIDEYKKTIIPQIHRVYAIQKNIHLENHSGDIIRGKIDFIASFVDNPEEKTICDNKTASQPYPDDSVANSLQLAIYCESEKIDMAAFIVAEKKVRKKDPKVRVNIIKDKVSEASYEKAFAKVDEVLHNINAGNFHKKDNQKDCFSFGRKCSYFKLCWFNNSEGLVKK